MFLNSTGPSRAIGRICFFASIPLFLAAVIAYLLMKIVDVPHDAGELYSFALVIPLGGGLLIYVLVNILRSAGAAKYNLFGWCHELRQRFAHMVLSCTGLFTCRAPEDDNATALLDDSTEFGDARKTCLKYMIKLRQEIEKAEGAAAAPPPRGRSAHRRGTATARTLSRYGQQLGSRAELTVPLTRSKQNLPVEVPPNT